MPEHSPPARVGGKLLEGLVPGGPPHRGYECVPPLHDLPGANLLRANRLPQCLVDALARGEGGGVPRLCRRLERTPKAAALRFGHLAEQLMPVEALDIPQHRVPRPCVPIAVPDRQRSLLPEDVPYGKGLAAGPECPGDVGVGWRDER